MTVHTATQADPVLNMPEPGTGRITARHRHVPALDAVRGLAILGVLLFHNNVMRQDVSWTLADRAFDRITHMGWTGVDLFFTLSGFLITGILLDARGSAHYFRNFYARRAFRIFPLYYAIVCFCLVILPHIPNRVSGKFASIHGSEWTYWIYLSNFAISQAAAWRHPILDVSWSLAIEEQFYFVWPAVVFFCPPKTLARVCVALLVIALVMRVGMAVAGQPGIRLFVLTPTRMDGLAAGSLLAVMARGAGGWARLRKPMALIGGAGAVMIAALACYPGPSFGEGGFVQCAVYTALAGVCAWLIAYAVTASPDTPSGRFLNARWLQFFGRYSYALYLFHVPLRAVLRDVVIQKQLPVILGTQIPAQIVFYAASIAMAVGAAVLSWHLYEKHFLKLKRLFPTD